jgi:hypothetical protein
LQDRSDIAWVVQNPVFNSIQRVARGIHSGADNLRLLPGGEGPGGWSTWITGATPGSGTHAALGMPVFNYVRSFYRLFMVPGMLHCTGGPGPNVFDTVTALERWVEQGKAPAQIVASHLTGRAVDRTRPLCPFPQEAQWKDSGSTDQAENFACGLQKP